MNARRLSIRIMEMVVLGVFIVFQCSFAGAADKTIHFQGKLKDASNNLLNGDQVITFKLWDNSTSTDPSCLKATMSNYTVRCTNGLFNVELGKYGELNGLPFDSQYWLEIRFGDNNILSPRQPIGSVGYAHGSLGDFNVNGTLSVGTGTSNDVFTTYKAGGNTSVWQHSAPGFSINTTGTMLSIKIVNNGVNLTNCGGHIDFDKDIAAWDSSQSMKFYPGQSASPLLTLTEGAGGTLGMWVLEQ
ncbi:MAG: hypothetical protein A2293_00910 [Elusimicrobia bacterium RIFOXYB2_FULL_49_7]|nr:MAG: hypothetical protein A2293_00910 [Elusimicrobia bacterium RIFOXYB2_FULL_49_7]